MSKYHCQALGVYANGLQEFFEGLLDILKESGSQYNAGSALATREDEKSMAGIDVSYTIDDKGSYKEISISTDGESRRYRVASDSPFDRELLAKPYEEERQLWLTEAIRGGYPIDFPLMEVKR